MDANFRQNRCLRHRRCTDVLLGVLSFISWDRPWSRVADGLFLWGGGSALVLFTGKLFARVLAIPWQALMLTHFFLKARAPEDALLPAAWILPAMIYLAVTAILQFRRNRNT
jgi:hypothetical protein